MVVYGCGLFWMLEVTIYKDHGEIIIIIIILIFLLFLFYFCN